MRPPEESVLDAAVERIGRRLAARLTRRSFLDRAARVGILVAGGPTLASLLVERAEARVCGQSGVSPRCPTFDCVGPGDVWGWCWYASPGCCSNGGLKKICDCCRVNHPNVHGYCPSGTNVRCIVESCLADPRVMTVPVDRVGGLTPVGLAVARSRRRAHGSAGVVVVADADPLTAAVAAPVAAAAGAPLLLTPRDRAASAVIAELQRLAAHRVLLVGPALSPAVGDTLARYVTVEHLSDATTIEDASVDLAGWVAFMTGVRRAFCVAADGISAAVAPAAAAAASTKRVPLLVGIDAARTFASGPERPSLTYLVGPEVASRAGEVPGGYPLRAGTVSGLAREVAEVMVGNEGQNRLTLTMVPEGFRNIAHAAVPDHGILLFHPEGAVGGENYAFVVAHRTKISRAVLAGTLGTLSDGGLYDLQSALNGFDTHFLTGVSGQGLPVISQPLPEREMGRARLAGAVSASDDGFGSYWISRANPDRR